MLLVSNHYSLIIVFGHSIKLEVRIKIPILFIHRTWPQAGRVSVYSTNDSDRERLIYSRLIMIKHDIHDTPVQY